MNLGHIRMKDVRSIDTGLHELGHHWDRELDRWSVNNKNPKAIKAELMRMGEELYGSKIPVGGYKSEGFAEFVRGSF